MKKFEIATPSGVLLLGDKRESGKIGVPARDSTTMNKVVVRAEQRRRLYIHGCDHAYSPPVGVVDEVLYDMASNRDPTAMTRRTSPAQSTWDSFDLHPSSACACACGLGTLVVARKVRLGLVAPPAVVC